MTVEHKQSITGEMVRSTSSPFPFVMTVIALLLGGGLGMLIPFIVPIAFAAVNINKVGAVLAVFGLLFVIVIALIILLRQDELAVTVVIAIDLCVDWYLGIYYISQLLALALLVIFFLARSPRHTWAEPRTLWLWALFLALAIYPAIRGALTLRDTLMYYPNIVFGAFIMFWLGTVIARDIARVRHLFQMLSIFGVLIAIHTNIQATTGKFLFEPSRVDAYLASVSNYQLVGSNGISRLGSFFIQPDFSGIFFAMMVFIPLGLFVESTSFLEKALYFAEVLIMLPALLFTYSASPWIAIFVGMIAFMVLVGRTSYRIQIPLFIIAAAAVVLLGFPSQVNLLLQHASDPGELLLRTGLWQTAIRVIQAFPLTGVGLGHQAYLQTAESYRAPAQLELVDHPHNSYLEWGAMAGLPVLFVFLALLSFALWQALRNWMLADVRTRSLLGAGIAAIIALSVSSWSNQGWTLPPLAALGWLILGVISSPLLQKRQSDDMAQEKSNSVTKNAR